MRGWKVLCLACALHLTAFAAAKGPLLVLDPSLRGALSARIPSSFEVESTQDVSREKVVAQVASGGGLVWIGSLDRVPPELWTGSFRPAATLLSILPAPDSLLPLPSLTFRKAVVSSVYIRPNKELPVHNVDEEPRADLIPILTAADRFGRTIGYPGALMRYYAPSLVGHRFAGSDCFYFAFAHPADAMSADGWTTLLEGLAKHFESRLQLTRIKTNYASYRTGERVQIRARVANRRDEAVSVELHFSVKKPGESRFHEIAIERRVPDGHDVSEAIADLVAGDAPGLWTVRVEIWQDRQHAMEPGILGNPAPVERRDIGFVVVGSSLQTRSIVNVQGTAISIDGRKGFWSGTNYYPSSSWWEWLWRDFRPLQASEDFASMRRTGYRIVRVWVDPDLDEESMRGMDAAVYLAAQQGIVLDVCVFTQWVRFLSFERPDGSQLRFDYRDSRDFNIYGVSFRNIGLQQQYIATLGARWKSVGNIIYDLANETYIKDPSADQIDPTLLKNNAIPTQLGTMRDSLLFRAWAKAMTEAIRKAGGSQIAMSGYMFSTQNGGDNYVGNRESPIEPWHSYAPLETTEATTLYESPASSHRPMLLEEFGIAGWNSSSHFDAMTHAALAAGADAAMSYEWGVRWLTSEIPYSAQPLRDALNAPADARSFAAVRDLVKDWPAKATGISVSPSGLTYGSIYTGTPFPAAAAVAVGRLGRMGAGMEPGPSQTNLYVVVPSAPQSTSEAIKKTEQVIGQLKANHVVFAMLQQDCLDAIPASARMLVVPVPLDAKGEARLAALRGSGISVVEGKGDAAGNPWLSSADVERVAFTPASIHVLTRQVAGGRLYALQSPAPVSSASLSLKDGVQLRLGLDGFAEVRQKGDAIDWIEASGNVVRDGSALFSVAKGRAIVATQDGQDIASARSVRVLATEPTEIHFPRKISSVALFEEGKAAPRSVERPKDGTVLKIDDEMVSYVVEARF